MPLTVASVPYVNAVPLVARFELEPSDVTLVYDVPSKLPPLLADGTADAILVSSIDVVQNPGHHLHPEVCIGSHGAVESVRLFSRVPFSEITSLALDANSMTSNALAQLILEDAYGVRCESAPEGGDLTETLKRYDAAILIGDRGMEADGTGLHVLDLGLAWRELTGLPFVWAGWISRKPLAQAALLTGALDWALSHRAEVEALAVQRSGWPLSRVQSYLWQTMAYEFSDDLVEGFTEFARRVQLRRASPAYV